MKRTICAAIVSALYVIAMYLIFGDKFYCLPSMKLNEVGDFFAGVFGPLAFLWLVTGYLQQGEELRTQAKELAKSVEQQSLLAKASQGQLDHLISIQKDSIIPRIRFDRCEPEKHGPTVRMFILLFNNGGFAHPITIEYPTLPCPATVINNLQRDSPYEYRFQYDGDLPKTGEEIVVKYRDALGGTGVRCYEFNWDANQQFCQLYPK